MVHLYHVLMMLSLFTTISNANEVVPKDE
jgi:hypothetical protein